MEPAKACEKSPPSSDAPAIPGYRGCGSARGSARAEETLSHALSKNRALLRPEHQLAVLQEQRVIHPYLAAAGRRAQIAYHVPVQRRDILAARLWIAVAQRHVDRPADLLVVEDVADAARDAEIVAEGELAEVARPVIQRELRIQELLPLRRRRLHHTPMLER